MFALTTAILSVALVSCGGEDAGTQPTPIGTASPTPAPVVSPTPLPSPAPSPEPVPPVSIPSATVFIAEGDSISVNWGGNYTGIFAASRPGLQFSGFAVGGSGVGNPEDKGVAAQSLWGRLDRVLAAKPTHVTVLIGANDMTDWRDTMNNVTDPASWLARLFGYTDVLRAAGVKVAVGTILPQCNNANVAYQTLFNARRPTVNARIRAAVGVRIDGVIDFAADPRFGSDAAGCDVAKYPDGVHPSDEVQKQMAEVFIPAADALLRY